MQLDLTDCKAAFEPCAGLTFRFWKMERASASQACGRTTESTRDHEHLGKLCAHVDDGC